MAEAGWPLDARGSFQATALHWAGFHGNAAMARVILKYDPPLDAPDQAFKSEPLGWTMHGSEHGWHKDTGDYVATAEALLSAGAKLPDKASGTPEVQTVIRAARSQRSK